VKKYGSGILIVCVVISIFAGMLVLGLRQIGLDEKGQQEITRLVLNGTMIWGKIIKFEPYRVSTAGHGGVRGAEGINVVIEYRIEPAGAEKNLRNVGVI